MTRTKRNFNHAMCVADAKLPHVVHYGLHVVSHVVHDVYCAWSFLATSKRRKILHPSENFFLHPSFPGLMHNFRLHVRDTLLEMIEMCYILVLSMLPPKLFENESHELFMHEYLHFQINPPLNPTWFNIAFLLYKQDWIDVFNKENPSETIVRSGA